MNNIEETLNILTIAGSDSCCGAGIQADLKAIHALGGFALTAITAVTAQNTLGVTNIMPVTAQNLAAQLNALHDDIPIHAIKIGMLFSETIINVVNEFITNVKPTPIVLDPVMVATSGARLLEPQAENNLINTLMPKATIITPNLAEAKVISGEKNLDAIIYKIKAITSNAVLIKDTSPKSNLATDLLIDGEKTTTFSKPKFISKNTHGTGCTLSSAIATFLAKQYSINDAVSCAKTYVSERIEMSRSIKFGHGHGPLLHLD